MAAARTLDEYRAGLERLLDDGAAALSPEDTAALRAIVRQRRNGNRGQELPSATPDVLERADEIVALLTDAACALRPRETQELDDLVAGQEPKDGPPPSFPVRMHRSGWPSR